MSRLDVIYLSCKRRNLAVSETGLPQRSSASRETRLTQPHPRERCRPTGTSDSTTGRMYHYGHAPCAHLASTVAGSATTRGLRDCRRCAKRRVRALRHVYTSEFYDMITRMSRGCDQKRAPATSGYDSDLWPGPHDEATEGSSIYLYMGTRGSVQTKWTLSRRSGRYKCNGGMRLRLSDLCRFPEDVATVPHGPSI